MAKAQFAAGCFWGIEAAFARIPGVLETAVGYAGGHAEKPTYEQVCSGRTGHAETVEVDFDPAQVSYADLVEAFFAMHDPTQLNRQGPDIGTQYRSAIFYADDEQKAVAEAAKAKLDGSGHLRRPVATEITPASRFWRAEEYHQKYFARRGLAACPV
jgi:peptide-methionine (S)-S-oxide reductase